MKMTEIYLVYGQTGEYSGASEWPVAAFDEEQKAEVWKSLCEAEVAKVDIDDYTARRNAQSRFDPNLEVQAGGTDYSVLVVPFNPPQPGDEEADDARQILPDL